MRVMSQAEYEVGVPLRVMMLDARNKLKLSQKDFAESLGFTPQYVCALENGRRLGSVEFVERVCDLLKVKPAKRREWHVAGARAHGLIV